MKEPHVVGAVVAREPSARRDGQYMEYDQAPSAQDPAAGAVSLWRSPAPPDESQGRPTA